VGEYPRVVAARVPSFIEIASHGAAVVFLSLAIGHLHLLLIVCHGCISRGCEFESQSDQGRDAKHPKRTRNSEEVV